MQIIQTALKLRTTVYVVVAFIVIIGSISYSAMPLENIPNIEIPVMLVSTVYPGVSPEDMERLVTNVLEKELKDLKDIKTLTSSSAESASTVVLEFETGTNLDVAYQKTRDKVEKARPDLPPDAEAPTIIEIEFSEFPMMLINLTGDYEGNKLKSIAETVQDRIEKIPGVLGVDLTGGKTGRFKST
jgi:multidrug efflux pump